MQFGVCLEGIMECDQERRLSDMLEDLSLCSRVFGSLGLLHNSCLFQHFHGIEFARIVAAHLANQEHLAVGCPEKKNDVLVGKEQRLEENTGFAYLNYH